VGHPHPQSSHSGTALMAFLSRKAPQEPSIGYADRRRSPTGGREVPTAGAKVCVNLAVKWSRSLSALGNLRPLPHFSSHPSPRARLPSLPVRSEIMTSGWAGGVGWEGVDPPLQDRIIVTRRTVTSGRSGCCTSAKGRNAAGSGGFVWSGAGRGQYLAVKSEAVSTRSFPARPTLAKTAEYPPLRQGLAGTASRHQPEGNRLAGVLARAG
jgi:hypothetical protein